MLCFLFDKTQRAIDYSSHVRQIGNLETHVNAMRGGGGVGGG